ncbi:hypothetical protein L249_3843 [Ophiocordyceps polyrhachis-furcata BCC 54312]|uniref:DUF3669 domain-containing protein n=1 Tax=Ophiocordyceps polyrhachis-furcata BCC 54312 TaxID=1330021 RepID=A0A367L5Y7_9HYPO|nr:hypothetical protein L249_3843 [Ophiocordyceps polyrhachis-furcata BCC 54312]
MPTVRRQRVSDSINKQCGLRPPTQIPLRQAEAEKQEGNVAVLSCCLPLRSGTSHSMTINVGCGIVRLCHALDRRLTISTARHGLLNGHLHSPALVLYMYYSVTCDNDIASPAMASSMNTPYSCSDSALLERRPKIMSDPFKDHQWPREFLGRALSTGTMIQASYSSAPRLQVCRQIGSGSQRTVFEQLEERFALGIRRCIVESEKESEKEMHGLIADAFRNYARSVGCLVKVPDFQDCVPQCRCPSTTSQTVRALPMPEVVRQALVQEFYPWTWNVESETIDSIVSKARNKHCLPQICFGVEDEPEMDADNFTLHDLPLGIRRMTLLGLDQHDLAAELGKAYALIHWGAGIAVGCVKPVLGTTTSTASDNELRTVNLFLMDFGRCRHVRLDGKACEVFFHLQMGMGERRRYIPHYRRSPDLFNSFANAYIAAGEAILTERGIASEFDLNEFIKSYKDIMIDFVDRQ